MFCSESLRLRRRTGQQSSLLVILTQVCCEMLTYLSTHGRLIRMGSPSCHMIINPLHRPTQTLMSITRQTKANSFCPTQMTMKNEAQQRRAKRWDGFWGSFEKFPNFWEPELFRIYCSHYWVYISMSQGIAVTTPESGQSLFSHSNNRSMLTIMQRTRRAWEVPPRWTPQKFWP